MKGHLKSPHRSRAISKGSCCRNTAELTQRGWDTSDKMSFTLRSMPSGYTNGRSAAMSPRIAVCKVSVLRDARFDEAPARLAWTTQSLGNFERMPYGKEVL